MPFIFVQWYARRYVSKNTLGGRNGVWAYRDTFIIMKAKPAPIGPAKLRDDTDDGLRTCRYSE